MDRDLNGFPDFDALLDGVGTLGVAVSGGGDSIALLQGLAEWGRRPLHVFCVDHQIHPLSAQWTRSVAGHAARLGLPFTALAWDGAKPEAGLSAAARQARHGLLAEAARHQGIGVLCLAHTADDIAEAQAMRAQGSNVGTPRTWSASPAWPKGRGVMLCRPLLQTRRAALRDFLRERGLDWIDDPANASEASLRARTRKALAGSRGRAEAGRALPEAAQVEAVMHDPEGWAGLGLLRFHAAGLADLPRGQAMRILAAAAVCAGGGDRLPRSQSVAGLLDETADGRVHTLCGARIWRRDDIIHVVREHGELRRHGHGLEDGMWDGRFEVGAPGEEIVASGMVRSQLGEDDRRWLMRLPGYVRASLPVVVTEEGPVLAQGLRLALRPGWYETKGCWVLPRFRRAVCRIERETDL